MADENVATWTLEVCKTKQRSIRYKITGCHTRITNIVRRRLSRRDAEKQLMDARTLLGELEAVNDRILALNEEELGEDQNTQHLTYATTVDNASALVETYLEQRQDDEPSELIETEEQAARRQELQDAEQRVKDARAALEDAEQALLDLGGLPNEDSEIDPDDSASQLRGAGTKRVAMGDEEDTSPPDNWIDIYVAGREKPHRAEKGGKSSVSVQLEVYSGQALDWFAWISMWHALVHITRKTASEKLAILKNYLRGDLADIVHGHGGGEAGYKEALQRLKSSCGDRTTIRAVHLKALERMEAPRGDPQSFRRFAERVRTHLFNLSIIGENGHADIIERLAHKLQLTDRLAWNDGRGAELERRTMNDFGKWLTSRATAYQNAYAIADEQHRPANRNSSLPPSHQATNQPQHRRNIRTYHGAASTQEETNGHSLRGVEQRDREPAEPHCLKCEGGHRLEDCSFFKELPVSDRMTFAQQRGLCYSCLGVRHGAVNCNFKKACGVEGCKLTHHHLLHRERAQPDRRVRPHTLHTGRRRIAFRMLRLDAFNLEGEYVPVNVLMDGGSDATFFREGLIRDLRLDGSRQTLLVEAVGEGSSTHLDSEYVELRLRTSFGETVIINGSTIDSIRKPVPMIDWEKIRKRWSHMEDVPSQRNCGGQVDILIGLDHATLITPTESRFGRDDEPTASRTRLGWTLQGILEEDESISTGEMTRDMLDVSCSPYVATSTTWLAEDDVVPDRTESVNAVRGGVYVDDYLVSMDWIEDVVAPANEVKLENGDFNSTDNRLLEAVGSRIIWDPATEILEFGVKVLSVIYTLVGTSGLPNPLRAAASLVVRTKFKLQEFGGKGRQRNDPAIDKERWWWENYLLELVVFARRPFPEEEDLVRIELRTLAVASKEACTAFCYTRVVYQENRVLVRHVFTLESKVGLSGTRPAQFVQPTLKRKVDSRSFWTDQECRLIPGRPKPTDAATRSSSEEEEIPRWWSDGPALLNEEKLAWPDDVLWMAAKEKTPSCPGSSNFSWHAAVIPLENDPTILSGPAIPQPSRRRVPGLRETGSAECRPRRPEETALYLQFTVWTNSGGSYGALHQKHFAEEGIIWLCWKRTHRIKRIRIRGSMEPRNDKDKTLGEI
jgi:hypothetical protein